MASIYFYYNALLQQSEAQAASARIMASVSPVRGAEPPEQEDEPAGDACVQERANQQDESLPAPSTAATLPEHSDAERAALQPRLNKLAFLQTAVAANLDALARALGPKQ